MALTSSETASDIVDTPNVPVLYIVDDEPELLASLAESLKVLGFEAKAFDNPEAMLASTSDDEVGCVITDLRMPGMGGVELQKQLRERDSCLSLILLTAFADVPTTVDVMKRGAKSVLQKPFDLPSLAEEIQAAMKVSEQTYSDRKRLREARHRLAKLSQEETAVLELAIEGVPNREIAERLSVSPRTVDRRRHSALQKLDADSVSEFAILKTLAKD